MACRRISSDLKLWSSAGRRLLNTSAVCATKRSDLTTETHTGQIFDEKDYRNVRFTNAKRYVNENWGIKLIDEVPPIESSERVVWCDGGDEHLGHPKVYINLDKPGAHACGYCGLRYTKKEGHH